MNIMKEAGLDISQKSKKMIYPRTHGIYETKRGNS